MQANGSGRTSRWIVCRRWIQIAVLATVAALWALSDLSAGAAFISRLTLRLGWVDPILPKVFLFWGLPIAGIAAVQLICYSLDTVFLSRRWTTIDLLRLFLRRLPFYFLPQASAQSMTAG